MAKMKLDTKKIQEVLKTRVEIVALAVAGVLVLVCMVWGMINFLGASSQEAVIQSDVAKIKSQHENAPVPEFAKTGKGGFLDWQPVKDRADANLSYFPYIVPGGGGGGGRFNPRVLAVDNDPEGKSWQLDYLRRGILTYDISDAQQTVQTFDNKGVEPVVLAAGKRLIVVSGTFPYLDQVNQFSKALSMPVEEVFAKGLAPTFEGLNIERRKIMIRDGKPVEGSWEPLYLHDPRTDNAKVSQAVQKLLRNGVYDYDEVDKYHDVIFGATVMPLPRLIGKPGYPDIALPALASRPAPALAKVDPKQAKDLGGAKGGGGDRQFPFLPKPTQTLPSPSDKDRDPNSTKFQDLPPHVKEQVSGNFNWFSPYGTFVDEQAKPADNTKLEPKKEGKAGESLADAKVNLKAPATLPTSAKALVRFIDADVEPGIYYQYRVQVRLANPNYNQPAKLVAHIGLTKDKELPPSRWEETPVIGPIPGEQQFYITNRERGFVSRLKIPGKSIDQTPSSNIGDKQVPFQVHKFVDTVDRASHSICDWVVAERLLVGRGEIIGRMCDIEVAAWRKDRSKWELVGGLAALGTKASAVSVDFRTVPPVTLLDFTGGKQTYKNPKTGFAVVEDDSSIEALLLMPDMTMQLRNGRQDTDDRPGASLNSQQRQFRFDEWKARMIEVMQPPAKGEKGK